MAPRCLARVAPGARPVEDPAVRAECDAVERELSGRGRVVLRPSGTEPVVRVTVEAENEHDVERLVQRLANAVSSATVPEPVRSAAHPAVRP